MARDKGETAKGKSGKRRNRRQPGPAPALIASGDTRGPDFICIGAQKAGTRWLFDQLAFHPGFWMPPIKELHYLNGSKRFLRFAAPLHDFQAVFKRHHASEDHGRIFAEA